jgi:phosphomannomutase
MPLIKSISGIRGTIGDMPGENLTPGDVVKFTSAFIILLQQKKHSQTISSIVIGRDARPSGFALNGLICDTLQKMGVNVIDVGLSTTPSVEMAVVKHQADGGIILTASHNPVEWNALKLLNEIGEFISAEEGKRLLKIAETEMFECNFVEQPGTYTLYERAIEDHINEILMLDLVNVDAIQKADLSIVFDAVNSTGGIAIPMLLKKLGVKKYKALYGEPTGLFPHNPEPLPEHLHEISAVMKKAQYDVGFVVDPDVDRLAIVMENGEMFGEEYTLVAVADYVLHDKKGNTVSNLSSSRALCDVSNTHGVRYFAAAVGEVNVVEMMKKTSAVIGGEGNGGIILPELHYGRDALAGIALFLSFMAKTKLKCSEIKSLYPEYVIIKDKIELTPDINVQELLQKITEYFAAYHPNTIDGVKVDFEQGWVHLRPSNTEPIIRIYVEAKNEKEAEKLLNEICTLL